MTIARFRAGALAASVLVFPVMAACSSDSASSDNATAVAVTSTADACELSVTAAPAGPVRFTVKNDGEEVTEFYVYEEDGTTIVSEVENIGPGTSRELSVDLEAGAYETACKPGQAGDGIRGDFTVS
ncbi:MAG: cupredoxin domain-containing protein [Acidimicrobiia bacterium]|nr:cupredoxin domain-containing protein [Acidimicrobiia bacterium]MDH4366051.1 cupredoxin domain-containing protein [Acidimicrobiia bacterium]MDH5289117.1 cupredoxin domain-containing protein [Acidimicrobiia bacterium]